MNDKPLTFGFRLAPYARFVDAADLVHTVVYAEELGYGTVSMPYHLLPPSAPHEPDSMKVWPDPVTLAAYLAARTSRILLMPGVLVIPYLPPIQLAKALATADMMSGGRIRLGAGAGWLKGEFERLGIPFDERGTITDEYLRAMQQLWMSERPSFSGRYVSFDDVSFLPRPHDPERGIPIYVGGTGPPVFRRAAALAEGWFPMAASPADLAQGADEIHRLMTRQGRDPSGFWLGCSYQVGVDAQLAALRANVNVRAGTGAMPSTTAPAASRPERLPTDEIVAGLRALAQAGADLVVLGFGWNDGEELRNELRWFSEEIMPLFRSRDGY